MEINIISNKGIFLNVNAITLDFYKSVKDVDYKIYYIEGYLKFWANNWKEAYIIRGNANEVKKKYIEIIKAQKQNIETIYINFNNKLLSRIDKEYNNDCEDCMREDINRLANFEVNDIN